MLLRVVAILLLLWLAVEVTVWLMKAMRQRLKRKMEEIERELRQRAAGAPRPAGGRPHSGAASSGTRTSRPANQPGATRLVRCATCGIHFPGPPGTSADPDAAVYCSEGCERAAAAGPS